MDNPDELIINLGLSRYENGVKLLKSRGKNILRILMFLMEPISGKTDGENAVQQQEQLTG